MSPENQKSLIEKFPKIFDEDFYFECSDGWYDLVFTLCANIQNYVDHYNESTKQFMKEGTEPFQVKASQVKSKFAGLRFYTDNTSHDEVHGMIRMAESMSFKICEQCGHKGSRKGKGWIFTMCTPCWDSHQKKKLFA